MTKHFRRSLTHTSKLHECKSSVFLSGVVQRNGDVNYVSEWDEGCLKYLLLHLFCKTSDIENLLVHCCGHFTYCACAMRKTSAHEVGTGS